MPRRPYPSDLSDAEWTLWDPLLPSVRPGGRPRPPLRAIVAARRYVLRTGCPWRALPGEYPPWPTVYHSFRAWRLDGTWERLTDDVRQEVRVRAGRTRHPSAGILESQSATTTEKGGRVAMTEPRKEAVASAIGWSIRWACWCAPWSLPPPSALARAPGSTAR